MALRWSTSRTTPGHHRMSIGVVTKFIVQPKHLPSRTLFIFERPSDAYSRKNAFTFISLRGVYPFVIEIPSSKTKPNAPSAIQSKYPHSSKCVLLNYHFRLNAACESHAPDFLLLLLIPEPLPLLLSSFSFSLSFSRYRYRSQLLLLRCGCRVCIL